MKFWDQTSIKGALSTVALLPFFSARFPIGLLVCVALLPEAGEYQQRCGAEEKEKEEEGSQFWAGKTHNIRAMIIEDTY